MPTKIDDIRKSALESIDVANRRVNWIMALAAAVEGGLLLTFFVVMDFDARLHWLLLISALLVYATLAVGLVALGSYVRVNTLRILKAIEIGHEADG